VTQKRKIEGRRAVQVRAGVWGTQGDMGRRLSTEELMLSNWAGEES